MSFTDESDEWLIKNKICKECGFNKSNIVKNKKTCKDCVNKKRIETNKNKNKIIKKKIQYYIYDDSNDCPFCGYVGCHCGSGY